MNSQYYVKAEDIKRLLDEAEPEEHVFWGKCLIVSYKLENGFTLEGRGAVVDERNFNIEIGRQVARQDAEDQLWRVEGYRVQLELYRQQQIEANRAKMQAQADAYFKKLEEELALHKAEQFDLGKWAIQTWRNYRDYLRNNF